MSHFPRVLGTVTISAFVAVSFAACGGADSDDVGSTTIAPTTTSTIPPASIEGAVLVTPEQPEGPYYPVAKPADRDNDLTIVDGSNGKPHGEVLALDGLLIYSDGSPVSEAKIEIWQTDANGVYLHPAFANEPTDPSFQYYGEALTDNVGEWSFVTILPAAYESRPPHIHIKVFVDEAELLTTQLYFSAAGADPAPSDALLTTEVFPAPASSPAAAVASHVIVLAG